MSEFKTISEVAEQLNLPQHVLRFWESQFSQIKPAKRRGGRRFYNTSDLETLQKIQNLLYVKGYTIKGAKKALNQNFMPTATPDLPKTEIKIPEIKPDIDKSRLKLILNNLKAAEILLQNSTSRIPEDA